VGTKVPHFSQAPEVLSCGPEAPSPRYSVQINGFLIVFIDFVRTYMQLQVYRTTVRLQDNCTHMQASSETFYKTFSDLTEERG
jgi:hypothetical protein